MVVQMDLIARSQSCNFYYSYKSMKHFLIIEKATEEFRQNFNMTGILQLFIREAIHIDFQFISGTCPEQINPF